MDMSVINTKKVGDKDPTNFPKSGDNKKVSLRNSNFPLFPTAYAEKLKEDHPDVWGLGGNIEGNNQFRRLVPVAKRGGKVETRTEEMAVRKREAWAARHDKDFRIAGVIAQIKWLVIGEKGLSYMKNLVRAEIERRKLRYDRSKKDLGKKSNAKEAMAELAEPTQKSLKKKGREHNEEHGKVASKKLTNVNYLAVSYHRGLAAYETNPESVRPNVTSGSQWAMGRVNGLLYALRIGEFKRKPYDTDLLPAEHPESKKAVSSRTLMSQYKSLPLADKEADWGFDGQVALDIIDEVGFDDYRKAFLYHGKGESKDMESYRLPVAKMVDGELKVVFRGVIAAGSSLRGSDKHNLGFYNLENVILEDMITLYDTIRDLYRAFGEEAPQPPWEEDIMEDNKILGKSQGLVCKSVKELEGGSKCYSFEGKVRASFPVRELIDSLSGDAQETQENIGLEKRHIQKVEETEDSFIIEFGKSYPDTQEVVEELTKLSERKKEDPSAIRQQENVHVIEGIASSTSIDSHGTEMARSALQKMAGQIRSGIPILPSHASHNADGIGEWDEVIGRTLSSDILPERNIKNAAESGEQQYIMKVRSVLYTDEPKTQALLRRLERGEPIGQSIGGWFENVDVIESEGTIQRVIVNDVTLDHIAITRAPSNPDSINLMTLSVRNALKNSIMEIREAVPSSKMMLADMDTPWEWDTEASNAVLGDPADWERYKKAHLYAVEGEEEKKSGYKLPVAKMIDGDLKLVYRGVIAAMSALNGARGGVDVPDEQRSEIYKNIQRYYTMFDKEAPPLRSEDPIEDITPELDTDCEDTPINKSETEQVVDTGSITGNNDAVEARAEDSATTKSSGEDMNDNDFAKFAELLNGALAPLAERVAALESVPTKEEKVEIKTEDSSEVSELKQRLKKAEDMITRVIETPIRRGSHKTPRSGILAEDMYTRNATAAEKQGLRVLPKIVKRHAEVLSDDNNKLTKNDLIDMLSQGLRAAEMDGILNESNNKLWQ